MKSATIPIWMIGWLAGWLVVCLSALAEEVKTAAKTSGELVWQLPMPASYKEQLKSSIADMKNTGRGDSNHRMDG